MHPRKRPPVEQPSDPNVRHIALTLGQVAIVDVQDFKRLSRHAWHACWCEDTQSYYAQRRADEQDADSGRIYMHREILGLKKGDGRTGDHVRTGHTLDNRRCNLRIATRSQNQWNSGKRSHNKSGFKGVSLHRATGKWLAQIRVGGRGIYLGVFTDPGAAHEAYKQAATQLHGEFARYE